MYKLVTVEDTVLIPPTRISEDPKKVCWELVMDKVIKMPYMEGLGVVVMVLGVEPIGDGYITFGDPNIYQRVRVKMIVFNPEVKEVLDGIVTRVIGGLGLIVSFGVAEGLLHVSQIYDDKFQFSSGGVKGVKTKYTVNVGDIVRTRIVSLTKNKNFEITGTITEMRRLRPWRIGLSMRTPGLGKEEWRRKTQEG
ncbi:MAG TPA: DNA-directed RNA polymerase [Euryarchaeota archaeon]|nr:DNA-directed RNA polymerase [Euryarchaeota archaeon]